MKINMRTDILELYSSKKRDLNITMGIFLMSIDPDSFSGALKLLELKKLPAGTYKKEEINNDIFKRICSLTNSETIDNQTVELIALIAIMVPEI